jgi:tRNA (guanine37-N1)-methyltransferase
MKIDVLTLFPAMFAGPLDESIIKRARTAGLLELQLHQLRDWTHDRHKTVDDRPFGGGPGMLLKPEPIV